MSVYKRGKVFYMNFTVNGQRIFKSTGKSTKREAREVEAAERKRVLKQQGQSVQRNVGATLLRDAIEQTYEAKWRYGKDSRRSYRRACNLADIAGNIKLEDIDGSTVNKIVKCLEARGSSIATINRYLASLKTILRHMQQPTGFISLKKERKGRIRVLSQEEEKKIVQLLRDREHGKRRAYFPEVGDLIEVLLDTGMRLSEALNMRYEDINFATGLISIWINKGDRPRSVPMTSRVRSILSVRGTGNPIQPFCIKDHQAETAWRWVRKEMGLESDKEFVIHSTRHTCASRMVNAGIDLYVVKEVLGHSSIQVTEKYAHLAPHKLSDAVAVLEV
jgi:integrase